MICSIIKLQQIFLRLKVVDNEELKDLDEEFVKQFLLNGTVTAPTEAHLFQTDALRKLTEKIKSNKTFCFKTTPGKFGWCATCRVSLPLQSTG